MRLPENILFFIHADAVKVHQHHVNKQSTNQCVLFQSNIQAA
ncbi:hypothetical protein [Stenoxybacter acetivorans]|nr:hypothetical protein [Stenoxybacter acetivorans]